MSDLAYSFSSQFEMGIDRSSQHFLFSIVVMQTQIVEKKIRYFASGTFVSSQLYKYQCKEYS
jgi:hypothetical protein